MGAQTKPSQTAKPFHSRIFRLYLGYVEDKLLWSDEKISKFLDSLETSKTRIYDDSTWFDLDFADQFYEKLVEETGDSNIAYHAGLYVKKSAFSATIYYLMRGFVSVGKIYELVSKFTPHFTKAATMRVVELRHQTALIESVPRKDQSERLYMCENRRGILQALPQIFDLPLAQMREIECSHKGGSRCLYHLKWKERSYLRYFTLSSVLSVGAFILSSTRLSISTSVAIAVSLSILSGLILIIRHLFSQRKELELHNSVLDTAVHDIERKNRELELISQISKLTHAVTSPEKVAETLVKSVVDLLQYDRALFLKVVPERQVLRVISHFGFEATLEEILNDTEFVIRADNTSGFFIKVVNTKNPVLIEDVETEIQNLSLRSQKFARMLKAKSFVAVPLKDRQGEVLGVLAVDYIQDVRKMSVSDQDLLMMLADHLSIAYYNSQILSDLETSLKQTKLNFEIQENLRNLFEKFIPSDLVGELSRSTDPQYRHRVLKAVRKKWVSVLFADIKDFSKIATELPAESVVDLLNTSFSILAPIISQYRGFIDKFTGDGLMAVFESNESTVDACKAAIHVVQSLEDVRKELLQKAYPEIHMGFGIHYGPAILGNVGSQDRLNFTVIGETVNLAARLESYTRQIGEDTICVSQQVKAHAGDKFQWKSLGSIELKGFAEKIEAFQLCSPAKSPLILNVAQQKI